MNGDTWVPLVLLAGLFILWIVLGPRTGVGWGLRGQCPVGTSQPAEETSEGRKDMDSTGAPIDAEADTGKQTSHEEKHW